LNYEITSRRSGDVEKVFADTNFANKELGWKAKRDLENMLLTAWNWQIKLKDLKLN
jgi:UDP-glucose 4-epimerase